jgi:hypothetical protein
VSRGARELELRERTQVLARALGLDTDDEQYHRAWYLAGQIDQIYWEGDVNGAVETSLAQAVRAARLRDVRVDRRRLARACSCSSIRDLRVLYPTVVEALDEPISPPPSGLMISVLAPSISWPARGGQS